MKGTPTGKRRDSGSSSTGRDESASDGSDLVDLTDDDPPADGPPEDDPPEDDPADPDDLPRADAFFFLLT
jgi:hypothetical protein